MLAITKEPPAWRSPQIRQYADKSERPQRHLIFHGPFNATLGQIVASFVGILHPAAKYEFEAWSHNVCVSPVKRA